MTPTRYKELSYGRQAPGLWRIVANDTQQPVGPHYVTKSELLADLPRYAADYLGQTPVSTVTAENFSSKARELMEFACNKFDPERVANDREHQLWAGIHACLFAIRLAREDRLPMAVMMAIQAHGWFERRYASEKK